MESSRMVELRKELRAGSINGSEANVNISINVQMYDSFDKKYYTPN